MGGCENSRVGTGECVASKLQDWREAEKEGRVAEADALRRDITRTLKTETKKMDRQPGTRRQHVDQLGRKIEEGLSTDSAQGVCQSPETSDVSVVRTKKGLAFAVDLEDKSAGFGVDLRRRRVIPKGDPGMKIPSAYVEREFDPSTSMQYEGVQEKKQDGASITRYRDSSQTKFDATSQHRPQEIVNLGGDKTTFQYTKDSTTPTRFFMMDKYGNAKGQGIRGSGDKFWSIDIPQEARISGLEQAKIVDVGVSKDGQFVMKSVDGTVFEQQRDGDFVTRDKSGRVISEVTAQGRTTNFEYGAKDTKPRKYTVTDAKSNVTEIGVKNKDGWSIFRPDPGARALDSKTLDGSKNGNPSLTVKDIHMDQRSGRLWQDPPKGDEIEKLFQEDKQWRTNHGNQVTMFEQGPNGEPLMAQFDARNGSITRIQYDKSGQPTALAIKGSHTNVSYKRVGDTSEWRSADGREAPIDVTRLHDGSIRITDEGEGRILTQYANGSESVQTRNKEGKYLVRRSTDADGTTNEITYNTVTHEPIRIRMNQVDGKGEVWTITSPLSHSGKHQVWKNEDGKLFEGKVTVRPDGTVRFEPLRN